MRSMDTFWTQISKTKIFEMILRLRTAFPNGVNDKIGKEYHLHATNIFSSKFPPILRPHQHIGDRKNIKLLHNFLVNSFY